MGLVRFCRKINDNAYRLHFPGHLRTFVDSYETAVNSWSMSSFQPRTTNTGGSESNDAKLSNCNMRALNYLDGGISAQTWQEKIIFL